MDTESAASGSGATIYLTALAGALIVTLVHFHLRAFSFWSSRGVRGPRPWPIFGTNIYYILGNKLEVDQKWRARYGKTYGLYEGYSPLLRTTDNQVIKAIYIKQFNAFTDRHGRFIYGEMQNNWLLWAKGESWANKRALISPMFSSAKMRPMFATMSQCVDSFLKMVDRRLAISGAPNQPKTLAPKQQTATFVKQDVSALTLDVIATSFFSIKLNTYQAKEDEFLRRAYAFVHINLAWLLVWLLIPAVVAKHFAIDLFRPSKMAYFDRLSKRIIDERKGGRPHAKEGAKKNDIIQAFMDAKIPDEYQQVYTQEDDKEAHYNDQIGHQQLEGQQRAQTQGAKLFRKFDDMEIRGQMSFLLLAGFETTAATITFCLNELAHQPQVQERLCDELRAKFATGEPGADLSKVDFSKENYTDLLDLKLLDAFVSEVLRMYSPLVDHNRVVTAPEGAELELGAGRTVHLPKGTPISTNGYILQRDQDYWPKPDEFDLTRFLPENRDKIDTCTFMPFGVGPRHCAGMRFALLEVKLALAKLLARYTITPGPENRAYPPKYASNLVFLQLQHTDFNLTPRRSVA